MRTTVAAANTARTAPTASAAQVASAPASQTRPFKAEREPPAEFNLSILSSVAARGATVLHYFVVNR